MKKNSHNPFRQETVFPIVLDEKSSVSIDLYEKEGRKMLSVIDHQRLSAGKQNIIISGNQLNSGKYTAKITIENSKGEFTEKREIIVN
ncbi:hypothetical protein [Chryseobacterium caseinilyticum]|uniref:T9SS type A sorting domain-containing protein n=1 Tax=Chryseobacterium caseinilyticum TaxID=2771428 RepID=A0ABR8ZAK6_9FLAO|nr:hypothetical protein [Chryseobacterium caseinilyticum]MBD8082343.1 hypothetical protein [Chryseobacterium caseinilyticum]